MKIKNFLDKWYDVNIQDDGPNNSLEYLEFQRDYRNVLKNIGNEIGFNLYSFNKSHYNFSVVVQSNKSKQFYYISISDVRDIKNKWANNILYRTMKHEKDWAGGYNNYSKLEELSYNLQNLDKKFLNNQYFASVSRLNHLETYSEKSYVWYNKYYVSYKSRFD